MPELQFNKKTDIRFFLWISSIQQLLGYHLEIQIQIQFRSKFKLTQKDRDYIAAKGLGTVKDHAIQFVNCRIASDLPKNDGTQTPMRGHPVFIAQHATATCCRGCIQRWHGIEKGRALNREEVDYVVALILGWIDGQVDLKGQ